MGPPSAHRIPVADRTVVLVLPADWCSRLDLASALDWHLAPAGRSWRALAGSAPRADTCSRSCGGSHLPTLAVPPSLHLADFCSAVAMGRSGMDRRTHGIGRSAGAMAIRSGRCADRLHGRRRQCHGAGNDHPGALSVVDSRCLATRHPMAACPGDRWKDRAAVNGRIAVVDCDACHPRPIRSRRVVVLRVVGVCVLHIDVNRGRPRTRVLAVLHS